MSKQFLFVPFSPTQTTSIKEIKSKGFKKLRSRVSKNANIDFIIGRFAFVNDKPIVNIKAFDYTIDTKSIILKIKKFVKFYLEHFERFIG